MPPRNGPEQKKGEDITTILSSSYLSIPVQLGGKASRNKHFTRNWMRLRFLKQTLTKLPKHNESSCENQNDELKYTKRLKLYTEGKYSMGWVVILCVFIIWVTAFHISHSDLTHC